MFCVGVSVAGTWVAADAPLASDNDKPAAPSKGTAHARRFRFKACLDWDMIEILSNLYGKCSIVLQPTIGLWQERAPNDHGINASVGRFLLQALIRPMSFVSRCLLMTHAGHASRA